MNLKVRKNELTGESLYYERLECGLEVFIMPRADYSASYAIFGTKYGSVDSVFVVPGEEEPTYVPDGIAHYLEHKMFDMPDGSNIFDKFSRLGANANAFTSFNMTAYLFSAADYVEENLEILMDYVQTPYFTEESVQKEQGIIGQEIGMYDDNPTWRVFFNFLGCLYKDHPVKKDVAGTVESISHITADYLYKCYNTFYNLSNMTIFVTGDFDPEKIGEVIEKNVKNNKPFSEEIKKIYPEEPQNIVKNYAEQKLSVAMPMFMFGFKDNDTGYSGNRLLKKYIEMNILQRMLFGKSTKLYKELYEAGIINDSFSVDFTMQPDYAYSEFSGESKEPKAVYKRVLEEIDRIKNEGLSEEDYTRAKKVLWGEYIRTYNDVEEFAHAFLSMHMMGIDLLNYEEVYKEITFEDVKNRFNNHFKKENGALSVILPTA